MGANIKRAEEAKLCWEQAEPMSDTEVEARLFALVGRNEPDARGLPPVRDGSGERSGVDQSEGAAEARGRR